MKYLYRSILLFTFFFLPNLNYSQDDEESLSEEALEELYKQYKDSIEATFTYQVGEVTLLDGDAIIHVPNGFKFLNKDQSEYVLTELWGNPPSPVEGLLFPEELTPVSDDFTYVIEISYSNDGYIKDDDAQDLDYENLLKTMQSDTEESNEYRIANGYPTVELVGWASPPFYDSETKKLHWAKELAFEDSEVNTLNYNIRILGRKGYLNLNAIGDIGILPEFQNDVDNILAAVEFNPGSTYWDFDPNVDKIAAYGIGGLIAGKLLAKAGILAKIGVLFAKFWKIIAIAAVALFAGFRKFFGKKEEPIIATEGGEES